MIFCLVIILSFINQITPFLFIFYRKNLHIAIEGGIGAGKTTLLDAVVQEFKSFGIDFTGVPEPIEDWTCYGPDGQDLLALMYDDPHKYSYLFQVMAMTTKFSQIGPMLWKDKGHLLVERTLMAQQNVFIPLLYEKEYISRTEMTTLEEGIGMLNPLTEPDLIVFVRAASTTCFDRMQKRSRFAERDISLEYIKAVDAKYADWNNAAENSIFVSSESDPEDTAKKIVGKIFIWAVKKNMMKRLLNTRIEENTSKEVKEVD